MTSPTNVTAKYIYDLPFVQRSELCKILNQNDKWEELAGAWMHYDMLTIQSLRKEKNPADELLTLWGHYNHTILELFVLLSRMQHYQAMIPLKQLVDQKYHVLIRNGDNKAVNNVVNTDQSKGIKSMQIGVQNFDQGQTPPVNIPKVVIQQCSTKNQPKILNKLPNAGEQAATVSNSNNLLIASLEATQHLLPSLPQASYEELTKATDNWNKKNILGRGGFGTVYKGTWKNTEVAIKRIECRRTDVDESYAIQLEQSSREIRILHSRTHENILSLYAYSIHGEIPCLVYQYLHNGSLEDRLLLKQNTPPLGWLTRHEIAKGVARGLQYLHTIGDRPLIHGDIKSANILLNKNFEPKIGDFGLAREGLNKHSMQVSRIQGTRPYLPEDFLLSGRLSTKVDTYSYGIVLLEMATGLSAYDGKREEHKLLKDFIESWPNCDLNLLMDRKAGKEYGAVFHNFIILGKLCSNKLAKDRPEMEFVYEQLDAL